MTAFRLLWLLAAAVCLAGCSGHATSDTAGPTSPPRSLQATSAVPSPTQSYCAVGRLASGYCAGQGQDVPSPAPPDPVGAVVCPKLFKAQSDGVIYDDIAVMQALGEQAASSADSLIAEKGRALAVAAQSAKHERGVHAEMGAAATDLARVCVQSGFVR